MGLFWSDPKRGVRVDYAQLYDTLAAKRSLQRFISFEDPYPIFLELLHSLLLGRAVDLLDHDFSQMELNALGLTPSRLKQLDETAPVEWSGLAEWSQGLERQKEVWRLALYSSGSTGTPKRIVHRYENLTRGVRQGERYRDNVWGFAYNPSHFAGLMVFFQALLNKNPMVNLFECPRQLIGRVMRDEGVTHISATPTFYRTVFPSIDEPVWSVRQVTSGGERFDPLIEGEIRRCFPNARLLNIYASTEAGSLLVSKGERFFIPEYQKLLFRVGDEGELLIHRSLMGEGIEGQLRGDWYPSGDVVELTDEGEIRFLSRLHDVIKVSGYNVNPHEVEALIKGVPGVLDVCVYPRKNRMTGSVLVADLVKASGVEADRLEERILDLLLCELQAWKVPRLFNFVEALKQGRTGKKVRL